ncbi:MAG: cupin domain-containing protein [Synechococcales bacterium]|nr:cupin domain-containing protein [Synechococcales bacterium]
MKWVNLNQVPIEAVSHNPEIRKQVMLRSQEIPHLTNFSQARFAPGQRTTVHSHPDMAEVFFVEAGLGEIYVNGDRYDLTVGTCVAIAPGEVHELVNLGESDLVLTYFGIVV